MKFPTTLFTFLFLISGCTNYKLPDNNITEVPIPHSSGVWDSWKNTNNTAYTDAFPELEGLNLISNTLSPGTPRSWIRRYNGKILGQDSLEIYRLNCGNKLNFSADGIHQDNEYFYCRIYLTKQYYLDDPDKFFSIFGDVNPKYAIAIMSQIDDKFKTINWTYPSHWIGLQGRDYIYRTNTGGCNLSWNIEINDSTNMPIVTSVKSNGGICI